MKLEEILKEQNDITLSSMQKYILITIHTSETPVLAFDRIRDNEKDMISSDLLNRYGFIELSNGQANLTEKGKQALVSYGLVDESGEITNIGKEIVNAYEEE